jgi:hypothetical protein
MGASYRIYLSCGALRAAARRFALQKLTKPHGQSAGQAQGPAPVRQPAPTVRLLERTGGLPGHFVVSGKVEYKALQRSAGLTKVLRGGGGRGEGQYGNMCKSSAEQCIG